MGWLPLLAITQAGKNAVEILGMKEAADALGLSRRGALWLAKTGQLEAVQLGHDWATTRQAVVKLLEERGGPGRRRHRGPREKKAAA